MNVRSLEETLTYENEPVLLKLTEHYGMDRAEAEDLFSETMRWMWLQAKSVEDLRGGRLEAPILFAITPSLRMLDEAWHTFILFTRDYFEFCERYLGLYIHHTPSVGETPPDHQLTRAKLEAMFSYVYDQLGRDTLVKWYSEYGDRYGDLELSVTRVPRSAIATHGAPEPEMVGSVACS